MGYPYRKSRFTLKNNICLILCLLGKIDLHKTFLVVSYRAEVHLTWWPKYVGLEVEFTFLKYPFLRFNLFHNLGILIDSLRLSITFFWVLHQDIWVQIQEYNMKLFYFSCHYFFHQRYSWTFPYIQSIQYHILHFMEVFFLHPTKHWCIYFHFLFHRSKEPALFPHNLI